jgi:hypothetical protein
LRLRTKADDSLLDVRADIVSESQPLEADTDLTQLVLAAVIQRASDTDRNRVRFDTDNPAIRRCLIDADFEFEDADAFVHAFTAWARSVATEALIRADVEVSEVETSYALAALAAALNALLALEGDVSRPFEVASDGAAVGIAAVHSSSEADIWKRLASRAPAAWRGVMGRSTQGNELLFGEVALDVIPWVALREAATAAEAAATEAEATTPPHEPTVLEAFSDIASAPVGAPSLPIVQVAAHQQSGIGLAPIPTTPAVLDPVLKAIQAELPDIGAHASHDQLRREPVIAIRLANGQTTTVVLPRTDVQTHRVVGLLRVLRDLVAKFPGSSPAELDFSGAEPALRCESPVDGWYFVATRSIKLNAAFVSSGFAKRDDLVHAAQRANVYDSSIPSPVVAVFATAWAYGYLDALARDYPRVLASLLTDPGIDLFDGGATLTTPFTTAGTVPEEARQTSLRLLAKQLGASSTQSRGAALAALVARSAASPVPSAVADRVRALLAGGLRNDNVSEARRGGTAPGLVASNRFTNTYNQRRG